MIPVIKKADGTYACGPEEDREPEVGELFVRDSIVYMCTEKEWGSDIGATTIKTWQMGMLNESVSHLDLDGVAAFEAWESKKEQQIHDAVKLYADKACKMVRSPKNNEEMLEYLRSMHGVPPTMEAIREAEHKKREERVGHPVDFPTGKPVGKAYHVDVTYKGDTTYMKNVSGKTMVLGGRLEPVKPGQIIPVGDAVAQDCCLPIGFEICRTRKVITYPSGKQEVGPVDIKLNISSPIAFSEALDKELRKVAAEGKGPTSVIIDPTSMASISMEGRCPKCGRPLETIPLLTGFSDVCPECDK